MPLSITARLFMLPGPASSSPERNDSSPSTNASAVISFDSNLSFKARILLAVSLAHPLVPSSSHIVIYTFLGRQPPLLPFADLSQCCTVPSFSTR